jgi:hypothetical protein
MEEVLSKPAFYTLSKRAIQCGSKEEGIASGGFVNGPSLRMLETKSVYCDVGEMFS